MAWHIVEVVGLLLELLYRAHSRHATHDLLSTHRPPSSLRVARNRLVDHLMVGEIARMRLAREGAGFHRNVPVILLPCLVGLLLLLLLVELIEVRSRPKFIVLSTVL